MNDRIEYTAGDTDLTVVVWLQDAIDGSLITGVTITDLDYRYIRVETDNDVTYSAADQNVTALGALTDAHSSSTEGQAKMLEIGLGAYRLDIPDSMVAAGVDFASMVLWDAASNTILPCVVEIQLGTS